MIDDEIRTHLLAKAQEAYPTFEADQVIVTIRGATFRQHDRTHNRRNNSGAYAIGEETIEAQVIIASEGFLDRAAFIQLIHRKLVTLGTDQALQEYQRAVHTDLVEVISHKGTVFFVNFTYTIYES